MNINEYFFESWLSRLESFRQKSLHKLRQAMANDNFDPDPKEALQLDGKLHSFDTYINSQHGTGFYIGNWFPFGIDGPAVLCSYGEENKISYSYVSPTLDTIV